MFIPLIGYKLSPVLIERVRVLSGITIHSSAKSPIISKAQSTVILCKVVIIKRKKPGCCLHHLSPSQKSSQNLGDSQGEASRKKKKERVSRSRG